MHDHAQRANRIGSVWNNQLRHQSELDGSYSSCELHHQQLYGIEERNLDWNCNWHNICRDWSCSIDRLHLHGGSNGRQRDVGTKFTCECDDAGELLHEEVKPEAEAGPKLKLNGKPKDSLELMATAPRRTSE